MCIYLFIFVYKVLDVQLVFAPWTFTSGKAGARRLVDAEFLLPTQGINIRMCVCVYVYIYTYIHVYEGRPKTHM